MNVAERPGGAPTSRTSGKTALHVCPRLYPNKYIGGCRRGRGGVSLTPQTHEDVEPQEVGVLKLVHMTDVALPVDGLCLNLRVDGRPNKDSNPRPSKEQAENKHPMDDWTDQH